ncbi:MAG: hypothetical protein J6P33_04965 [Spirochaetales bacterium]|nr:hypothetical protein [Spirochaetales bacterium]
MKRKTAFVFSIALIILLLSSCATSKVEAVAVPASEPSKPEAEASAQPEAGQITTSQPEAAQQETDQPAVEKAPSKWKTGEIGPDGGLVFECGPLMLEISQALYETASFEQAKKQIEEMGFRLPTIDELKALYEQLVLTEISDLEWTYYWSCDESADGNVMIMNFDTGFEGKFYKDMDFVSAIGVKEI